MSTPRSVRTIDNGAPYPLNKFKLGTKLHKVIEFSREVWSTATLINELRTKLHTGGDVFALANELRTKLHTGGDVHVLAEELRTKMHTGGDVFTLINELRTRLHTAGDYQVLISALRALFIANGAWADRLIDLEDKAYNFLLTAPDWKVGTGAAGDKAFQNGAALTCIVNGVYQAALYAATNDVAIDAGTDTGVGEFRAVTLSVTALGALVQTVSAIAGAAPVTPPRPPSGNVPVGVIQIPASFTHGVTSLNNTWFTQGFPRRLAVHTPLATADVAAIAAPAVGAMTATAIAAVSATAIAAVSASALAGNTALKPESLPDIDG